MKKVKVKWQDKQFVVTGTLCVKSQRLRRDGEGRITEDPELLTRFSELVEALSQKAKEQFRFDEICVEEGAYAADLLIVEGLMNSEFAISALLNDLDQARLRLEVNIDDKESRTASHLGVSAAELEVLEITSELRESKNPAVLITKSGTEWEIAAPDSLAIVGLAPDQKRNAKKVNGEVQGIGRGDSRGCSIRLAKGNDFIVSGLTLQGAWEALSHRKRVVAVAHWSDGAYLIDDKDFKFDNQIALDLDE